MAVMHQSLIGWSFFSWPQMKSSRGYGILSPPPPPKTRFCIMSELSVHQRYPPRDILGPSRRIKRNILDFKLASLRCKYLDLRIFEFTPLESLWLESRSSSYHNQFCSIRLLLSLCEYPGNGIINHFAEGENFLKNSIAALFWNIQYALNRYKLSDKGRGHIWYLNSYKLFLYMSSSVVVKKRQNWQLKLSMAWR